MKININKIANVILYSLDKKVANLNDKKLSILLFLIDYKHKENHGSKIFDETYTKTSRNPEPTTMSSIFDIIANDEDLEENDERLYIIQELLDHLDIEVIKKDNFIELKFLKMEENFDNSVFSKIELTTISNVIKQYKNETPRKMANACFGINIVRETKKDEIII